MRKKIIMFYLAILLVLARLIPVSAANNDEMTSEAVSAYCLDGKLYTFLHFPDSGKPEQLSGSLMSNGVSVAENITRMPLQDYFTMIHYVLLIDVSTSMQGHAEEIKSFTDAFAKSEKVVSTYSVLTFGDQFQAVSQNLTDTKEMQTAVNNLQYTGVLSNPYDGVEQAIKYLNGVPRQKGELLNLILVTDGSLYIGDMWEGERQALEKQKAKSTSELITSSPEIVLHTLHIGEWDTLADQTFSKGTGLLLNPSGKDVSTLVQELVEFTEGLYRMDFSFYSVNEEKRTDLTLQLTGRQDGGLFFQEYELKSVPTFQLSEESESEEGKDTPSPTPSVPGGNEEKPSEDGTEKPSKAKPDEDEEHQEEEPDGDKQDDPEDKEDTDNSQNHGANIRTGQWFLIISVLGVIIIILLIIIAVVLFTRKRAPKKQNEIGQEGNIYMRLDVISGNLLNVGREFYLYDQITIGRSRKCDIVWKDKCVSGKNTRIYIENQKIYIEDLNSAEGTALGGMRLYAPNILRSGEQISIGKVCFVLRF